MKEFGSNPDGLRSENVSTSRVKYGRNVVTDRSGNVVLKRFYHSFVNIFTVILALLALFSYFIAGGGIESLIVIITLIIVSGTLTFIQETKSGNAAAKLIGMVDTAVNVRRDGVDMAVDARELVVGDIVILDTGSVVPADLRIIQSNHLKVDDSALTGESGGVVKESGISDSDTMFGHKNLVFMGTNVISGSATCIVVAVGDDTVFGSMANELTKKKAETTYDKGARSVMSVLLKIMAVLIPVVFIIMVLKGTVNFSEALITAVALAIGLMPEMLPTIVSANLAKGAMEMSKKKVIVKDMSSIQNLGAMDVLCTDKTGTITQNKITVLSFLDVNGKKDEHVAELSYLNSNYLTAATNEIDDAIIDDTTESGVADRCSGYDCLMDIPFDPIRKRASVVVKKGDSSTFIVKGAVYEIISGCDRIFDGNERRLDEAERNRLMELAEGYSAKGMRVLCIAYKDTSGNDLTNLDENGTVCAGLIVFCDPVKASAKEAVVDLMGHGIRTIVLTGDIGPVAKCVCDEIGIAASEVLTGAELAKMSDDDLRAVTEKTDVFARLTPDDKARVITVLRANGHIVGMLGDGINDVVAMRAADVSISVDTAVDIAKDTADMILLEKDLGILKNGVVEGRKVYANTIKYVKMTSSANFGYMFSLIIATIFFDFEPMTSMQILVFNLIIDISCIAIPWDNVDDYFVKSPRNWDAISLRRTFTHFGPLSTLTDVMSFTVLTFLVCPLIVGQYTDDPIAYAALFQSCWFAENFWMQVQIIHIIRTPKIPFLQSCASIPVLFASCMALIVGTLLPFTAVGEHLGMVALPWQFAVFLPVMGITYFVTAMAVKKYYLGRYSELL